MERISVEDAQSAVRATVSRALAEALVLGIDEAAQNERPLTQLQQIDVATMAIMSYDKAIECSEEMGVMSKLREAATAQTEPEENDVADQEWSPVFPFGPGLTVFLIGPDEEEELTI